MALIENIEMTITLDNGRSCKVSLSAADGINRWGADTQTLGEVVEATEAMDYALHSGSHYSGSESDAD